MLTGKIQNQKICMSTLYSQISHPKTTSSLKKKSQFVTFLPNAFPTLLPVYCELNRANQRQVCGVAANTVLSCPQVTTHK